VYKIRYRAPIVPGQRKTREVVETLAHCPNLNAAKGVLAKRRASIFEGTYRPRNAQKPVLLAEFIETFLAARKGELASWSSYKAALKLHVAPFFAKKYLFEITTGDCEDYRRHRIAQGAAPASVRNELRYMQSVFADARKRGIVTTDPVADVSFAGTKHAPTKAPTPAEILALVEAARQEEQGSFLRPLFFVMLCTGLRLQSALALRWENVDYDGGAVGTMQKGGTWVWPPMPQLLRDELQRWQPISEGAAKDGWVFPSVRTHEPVTQTAVQKAWPRLLRRAKVDGISRHDLRRFVVTRLRELGADDKSIGRISGHATAAMIDRYDKRGIDAVTEFAEKATDLALLAAAADRTSIAGIRNGVSNTEKQNAKNEVE
jgi:integrase